MIGLLGPNGAGKSTLISILTGLDTQDSGSVFYNGEEKIPKESIGYVPQDIALYEELNAIDNLTFLDLCMSMTVIKLKGKSKRSLQWLG